MVKIALVLLLLSVACRDTASETSAAGDRALAALATLVCDPTLREQRGQLVEQLERQKVSLAPDIIGGLWDVATPDFWLAGEARLLQERQLRLLASEQALFERVCLDLQGKPPG